MTKRADVKGAGIQISQSGEQRLGQVLVEQQTHWKLRGRDRHEPTLAFGGECETGENVLVGQLRKVVEDFGLGHPASQIPEHIADREAGAADAGFAEADRRVDGNALELCYGRTIRLICRDRQADARTMRRGNCFVLRP